MNTIPGKLVVFLIGQTEANLETTEVVEIKTVKSAPSYPDVIPCCCSCTWRNFC